MNIPLCVDLDGTLIKSDSLFEALLLLIKKNPMHIFLCVFWLAQGRAYLKQKILNCVNIDPNYLPYSKQFLSFLKQQHAEGRKLILVTASDISIAQKIANKLNIFHDVLASDGKLNLKGKNKRDTLNKLYGKKQYDYAGNSNPDLTVWSDARYAIAVNAKPKLIKKAQRHCELRQTFNDKKTSVKTFLKAIRVHQYAKNALIFVPLLAGHLYFDKTALTSSILAFIAFCLLASSVYVLNDLLDLQADRAHHSKQHRAFASGDLAITTGLFLVPLFFIAACIIALFLPLSFIAVALAYYATTLLYSFYLKRLMLVDVFVLAVLYTLRIAAGIAALHVAFSEWLISFSIFFFLSLAFVKRYSEVYFARKANKTKINSRGYLVDDIHQLSLFGVASGYVSTLIFALYINSTQVMMLYNHPQILWLACIFLLFWITRIWMLAMRGQVDEDPVLFAIKDKVSFVILMIIAVIAITATI